MHYSFLELYNSFGEQNFNFTGCETKPGALCRQRQAVSNVELSVRTDFYIPTILNFINH